MQQKKRLIFKDRRGKIKVILWSSLGWKEEVETKKEVKEIAAEKIKDYKDQKITLSWLEEGQQQDKIIYNGIDEAKKDGWLDMIKQARELEKEK